MERFHLSVWITLLILAAGGCEKPVNQEKAKKGPAYIYMARHITAVHGVRIGDDETAELVVKPEVDGIEVVFTPGLLERLEPDCIHIIGFNKPRRSLNRKEYLGFLDKFHAYLMISPPKPRSKNPER
ncbi:MAG: hypothetical protein P9M00_09530 [Candidatus Tritonobacter lacicola]|nr:hypothetical protein [Candidatus Tritonobacter lacicola]